MKLLKVEYTPNLGKTHFFVFTKKYLADPETSICTEIEFDSLDECVKPIALRHVMMDWAELTLSKLTLEVRAEEEEKFKAFFNETCFRQEREADGDIGG